MRILVPLKQVPDPDASNRIRLSGDHSHLEFGSAEPKTNPFDEYALEAALRLTEDGRAPRTRLGETVVATLGSAAADVMLRAALATGASKAIRITASDDDLDVARVAHVLAQVATRESCDLVIMGKQSVDGDGNEVGQRLAHVLGWPQATFACQVSAKSESEVEIEREIDGGIQRLTLGLPAVITVDLRIVTPNAVRSLQTPNDFSYSPGVRFAPLPAIMQARRKPLAIHELDDFAPLPNRQLRYVKFDIPSAKSGGRVVATPTELVQLLVSEAKVI